MTRSIQTFMIAAILATGLVFLPAAYATHPHDAPGATSAPATGEGGMMGKGGMTGMGGMMAMMNQMNQMMDGCARMMGSSHDDDDSGVRGRRIEAPDIP